MPVPLNAVESERSWRADGKSVIRYGATTMGAGPRLLLLPALSSISTRKEMAGLQVRLAPHFTTTAIDWPGFGDLDKPAVAWSPAHYRRFLADVLQDIEPDVTVAAGHAAAYALAVAEGPFTKVGKLVMLSPTWRGPLPTMAKRRLSIFRQIAQLTDVPGLGRLLYRINVNGPVVRMMARGHVYENPKTVSADWMGKKRYLIDRKGARHASVRFVTGELDAFATRGEFLAAAAVAGPVIEVYSDKAPRKSQEEMAALAGLPNVRATTVTQGRLSFYEEFPELAATAILDGLRHWATRKNRQ